ncbi:hypothetical protein PFDG_05562 [Plasmodium falciparum Dd2]|uniref:Uncharacterized protein n=1 Tax=Plasmodium falciparum (isolate Dd2) TaxID=57267 RepID=A0A0L7M974_PLAF4|nr:hypothetical protein PFDG_05562 [Plasmodium falciparum Dd2]
MALQRSSVRRRHSGCAGRPCCPGVFVLSTVCATCMLCVVPALSGGNLFMGILINKYKYK